MNTPKFRPGQIVATPGCLAALADAGQTPHEVLVRHLAADWGNVDPEDHALNDAAILDGSRILSAYTLATGVRIWVISEAVGDDGERTSTTLLLPEEY